MVHYTFDIDGRSINIIYSDLDTRILGKDSIFAMNKHMLALCSSLKLTKFFPTLNLVFYSSASAGALDHIIENTDYPMMFHRDHVVAFVARSARQVVYDDCLLRPKNTLYINLAGLRNGSIPDMFLRDVKGSVIHELTHLLHDQRSGYAGMMDAKKRLGVRIVSLVQNGKTFMNMTLQMRSIFLGILEQLVSEGMASYAEGFLQQDPGCIFTPEHWKKGYNSAAHELARVIRLLEQYYSMTESYLREASGATRQGILIDMSYTYEDIVRIVYHDPALYAVGRHMIHTILYYDKTVDFEDLLSLSYPQILRRYEQCMKRTGEKALVSYNSGNGFLDYSTWLKRLNDSYEQAKKL